MGFSKEQVEQHIANLEKRFTSEKELKQLGYEFAKLCYQVEKYGDAIRYLKGYLSLNSNDYRAHKWMGRLYVATDDLSRAILHYKQSLRLKKDQRDVIYSVAELYCKIVHPPVEEVKESLAEVQHVNRFHPIVFALSEKIHSLEGSLSSSGEEELISKQLILCSNDVDLHIRLVKLYATSGNLQKAHDYCNMIDQEGYFVESLLWQQCSLHVSEKFCEEVGCNNLERRLDSLISVLEVICLNFALQVNVSSLTQCAALLLKYDTVLFTALQALHSFSTKKLTVYHIALQELSDNLQYLVSQYLYLYAHTSGRAVNFQLGQACLLASLRASPHKLEYLTSQALGMRHIAEKWHVFACIRISTIGRHLMVVRSAKGVEYLKNLSKSLSQERSPSLSLVKALFTGNPYLSGVSVYFGTNLINFSIQESFLAMDDTLLNSFVELPSEKDMLHYDEVFVSSCGKDLKNLVWMYLTYNIIGITPEVGKWLGLIFKGLQLDSSDLTKITLDTLSLCDLEAFLVLVAEEFHYQLSSQDSSESDTAYSLFTKYLPCNVCLSERNLVFWNAINRHCNSKLSVLEAASVKMSIQEQLHIIRGCKPLKLDLKQLTLLARHFKSQSELLAQQSGNGGINYNGVVSVLLKWSSHYWSIVSNVLRQQETISLFPESDALLMEARMNLANIAIYKHDTSRALELYSQVNTPQAAWNQSQIYLLISEKGDINTPEDVQMRVSNLTKALDTISLAITRLNDDDDPVLRNKLCTQQDELKQLLKDVKNSPVACVLQYDDSPLKPYHFSTPAKMNSVSSSDVPNSSQGYGQKLNEKDDYLLSMSKQLKQLKDEMEEIKSLSLPNHVSSQSVQNSSSCWSTSEKADRGDIKLSESYQPEWSVKDFKLSNTPSTTIGCFGLSNQHVTTSSQYQDNSTHGVNSISSTCVTVQASVEGLSKNVSSLSRFGASYMPFSNSSVNPPYSTSKLDVSTQDFGSSQHPSTGSFVFGLPTSVSNPFQFTPPTSLLYSVPFCHDSVRQPFQFSTDTTFLLGSQNSLLLHESSDHSKPAVITSSNSNVLGTLPSFSIKSESPDGIVLFTSTYSSPKTFPVSSTMSVPVSAGHLPVVTSTIEKNIGNNCLSIPVTSTCSQLGYLVSHTTPLMSNVFQPTCTSSVNFASQSGYVFKTDSSATPTNTQTATSIPSLFQGESSSRTPTLLSLLSHSSHTPTPVSDSALLTSLPVSQIAFGQDILNEFSKSVNVMDEATVDAITCCGSDSPHFEPLLSLPLMEDNKSGEEDEIVLFSHRAKLYRFNSNQWKERGVGEMKILKHKVTGKVRLLMRRDQILKLCCNHYVTVNMSFKVIGPKQLAWYTSCDFSDGVSKPEKFTVKFKHQETSDLFKQIIEECVLTVDKSNVANDSHSSLVLTKVGHNPSQSSLSMDSDNSFLTWGVSSVKSLSVPSKGTISTSLNNAWTCNTCLVRNEATNTQCVACEATYSNQQKSPPLVMSQLMPPRGWVCLTCLVQNRTRDTQCIACGSTKPVPEEMSTFAPRPCVWTCDHCLVQNKSVDLLCVACKTHKNTKREVVDEDTSKASNLISDMWNCMSCSTSNSSSLDRCIKCWSPRPSFYTKADSNVSIAPRMPYQFPLGQKLPAVSSKSLGGIQVATIKPIVFNASMTQSRTEAERTQDTGFILSDDSLSVHKIPNVSVDMCDQCKSPEGDTDTYITPVTSLPDNIEMKTGEEGEEVLFCDHVKLFRFDDDTSNWKERGVGNIKILSNKVTRKDRLLMRRDQVLKICCNHNITAKMSLTPMPSTNKAWIWYTSSDFADEEGKPEKFAVKFKSQESAEMFKHIFEQCVNHCNDHSSASVVEKKGPTVQEEMLKIHTTGISEEKATVSCEVDDITVIKVEVPSKDKIELARRLLLPDNFFNYENKVPCTGCRGCTDHNSDRHSDNKDHTSVLSDAVDHSKECIEVYSKQCVFGNTGIPDKPLISFADLAASQATSRPLLMQSTHGPLSHTFKQAGEALFSTYEEEINDIEAEDDIQFKALVSLPEVEVRTGEELEELLFNHRAKLFRFDETDNHWKERGIGDIKLLRNLDTNKTRVLMRRDQILKVCCNHFITADMKLLAYQEKSWMWCTLNDFADEIPRPEKFAVRFKSAVTAQKFKVVFEDCVSKDISFSNNEYKCREQSDEQTIHLQEIFAPKPDSWTCNVCSIFNPESSSLCLACQAPKPKQIAPQKDITQKHDLHNIEGGCDHGNELPVPLNTTILTSPVSSTSTKVAVNSSPTFSSNVNVAHTSPSVLYVNTNEEVTFSANAILYCEDYSTKQWKEVNSGSIKIIKNNDTNEKRLLMVSSDQKSVVCAHRISTMMHLRPDLEESKAWIWSEFDSKPSIQKYRVEFRTEDDALKFKNCFETSLSLPIYKKHYVSTKLIEKIGHISDVKSHQPSEESRDEVCSTDQLQLDTNEGSVKGYDDDVIFMYEEIPDADFIKKAEELLLPRSFFLYEQKPPCTGCRGCVDKEHTKCVSNNDCAVSTQQAITESTESSSVSDDHKNFNLKVFSSAGMLSFADVKKQDSDPSSKNISHFQFEGAGKPLFTLLASKEKDDNPEAEADIVFQPIVSLPQTYSIKSWDEDTEILFCCRAKLFRFDGSISQWKERGIGDMKIVQHRQTKKIRLIMRRDQIFKLCCNHYVSEDMKLERLQSDRSWMWFTPSDFSDDTPQSEKLAIRFKHDESGLEFKKTFDECVSKCKLISNQVHDHVSAAADTNLSEMFQADSKLWECEECFIRNKISDVTCAACGSSKPFTKNASESSQEVPTGIKCIDPGKVFVSVPRQSTEICSELPDIGCTSGGIKVSLLQDNPLTATEISSFTSLKTTNSNIDTDYSSIASSGGIKIPLLKVTPLYSPSVTQSDEGNRLELGQGAEMFQADSKSWECEECFVRNKISEVTCAACGSSKPFTRNASESSQDVPTDMQCIDPGKVFVSVPRQSTEICSKLPDIGCASGGVKVSLLQDNPLTATEISSFTSLKTTNSDIDTDDSSIASSGGVKIPLLKVTPLYSPSVTQSDEGNRLELGQCAEMFQADSKSWECEECFIRNKISEVTCAACGSSKPFTRNASESSQEVPTDMQCIDPGKVFVSVPRQSTEICSELPDIGCASGGIKVSLLQDNPLTATEISSFSLKTTNSNIDTDNGSIASSGGIKIPLLNVTPLYSPSVTQSDEGNRLELVQGGDSDTDSKVSMVRRPPLTISSAETLPEEQLD